MSSRLEVLIEVPGVLQVSRTEPLNLILSTWATDREASPKTKKAVADGWVRHGYYNAYSIRYGILEIITKSDFANQKGDILEVFKEIDKRLQAISDQIKEVT